MANYRKHQNFVFSLRNVGLTSDAKFYVNENLTQTNFNILRGAIQLKKKCSAFTVRGCVYIKKDTNDDLIQIDDMDSLKKIFPNHVV